MIDNRTTHLNLPLPNASNLLSEDVTRLADAINGIDTAINGKAAAAHTHTGVYAPAAHDHAGVYATAAHDHAGVYATAAHDHAGVYQAYDADLSAVAALSTTGLIERTGAGTAGTVTVTAAAKALLDDADAATMRSTLGLAIGTNVQAYDADLSAVAALSTTGLIERTGAGTAGTVTVTAAAKALLDDADAATMRATLGISSFGTGWLVKSANYTAVAGDMLVLNTAAGAFTITLPASPAVGDAVRIKTTKDAATNSPILGRNGANINGTAENLTLDVKHFEATFVYVNATIGWSM